ncbi:TPA: glycine cleavage system aminomethyltransferase GcvT [Candidatus Latescibacteria bacterium]|nr:glycine cleavage system aminomethyltransferase GcvT [Candidatus Latescibacterota bacterium]
MPGADTKQTPLHVAHVEAGARMVPFGGWDMPVQYSSIKEEHHAVRSSCGLFDVSHMGEFAFRGLAACDLLQHLTTNDIAELSTGACHYTFLLNGNGGTVDDAMVYRRDESDYLVVVNAGNIDKDWAHVQTVCKGFAGADVTNESDQHALVALQGPLALTVAGSLVGVDLTEVPFHALVEADIDDMAVLVATSGYTGENGVEIFVSAENAVRLWSQIADLECVSLCGLGARDTLRLEASLALYGHELDDDTSPLEAKLGFAVSKTGDYVGADRMREQRASGTSKSLVMLEMVDRAIPRQGYEIVNDSGSPIGEVTSGSLAPWLKKQIGMGYVRTDFARIGQEVGIKIRDKVARAIQVKRPFYRRPSR